MTRSALPAFGQADLSNCEREQIHLAGSIQAHGALLVLDDEGTTILQASANAGAFLNVATGLVGQPLASLPGNLATRLGAYLDRPLHIQAAALRARVGVPAVTVDALIHRPLDGGLVVELEHAGPSVRPHGALRDSAREIMAADTVRGLGDTAASLIKQFTGYDRVMIYRFDELGHGEIMSERREDRLEAFLGNRYPASDIPQIARRLYLQNRMRLLVDIDYEPVPLEPRLCPLTGQDLDMSMCALRSMSPIHLQYLRNMGVQATLVLSLVVGGELWGLVACHHYSPCFVPFETRALCEMLAELVAIRISALECARSADAELMVRQLETDMAVAVARGTGWEGVLFDSSDALASLLHSSGMALVFEGAVRVEGAVPATDIIRKLAGWLDGQSRDEVLASATVARDTPGFRDLLPEVAGVLAVPISSTPGDYLMWFRPERKTMVTWGGDPRKPVIVGTDPRQLSPRLSFAQWHEVVEDTSEPWTRADRTAARLIGTLIAGVVLRSQSVSMLAAQDQLESLSRQLRRSRHPVLLANATGRIVLINEGFASLLQPGRSAPLRLDDLPPLFAQSLTLFRHIDDLLRRDRPFLDRADLSGLGTPSRPLAIRGEPVLTDDGRRIGFTIQVEEAADRIAADAARERFEQEIADPPLLRDGRFDLREDRDFGASYAGIVENARLAAVAITYGAEMDGMAVLLESVRASVSRATDLLELLTRHGSEVDGEPH